MGCMAKHKTNQEMPGCFKREELFSALRADKSALSCGTLRISYWVLSCGCLHVCCTAKGLGYNCVQLCGHTQKYLLRRASPPSLAALELR